MNDQQLALLDVIVREAVVLERVCLTPKIMHPSEAALAPTPTVAARVPTAEDKTAADAEGAPIVRGEDVA